MEGGTAGRRALVHSESTHELLANITGWELREDSVLGPAAVIVVGGPDWVADPPSTDEPLRVTLVGRSSLLSGVGVVRPSAPWCWLCDRPMVEGLDALDDYVVPAVTSVTLPGGEWFLREFPRASLLQRSLELTLSAGHPTAESIVTAWAAYDAGWTLPFPSPRDLTVESWNALPSNVIDTMADFELRSRSVGLELLRKE